MASRAAHILVAEDIVANQVLIRRLLEAEGHRVTLVANGVLAVSAARDGRFDLVFMDIDMPEMDGIAATSAIRALAPPASAVPIVALTANSQPGQEAACRAAGMDDFLMKPVDRGLLCRAVERWSGAAADRA